ncbi:GntR family transcriptional regulator [Nocardia sp. CA2R105]|uniref:GntR family transcriptional regulator n=1 Tax=Nocardia coffeae TaxID=2873381 RepID=UPI001CA74B09|nr:GntR family transcriptional regulator [Nocardia coffeae]MBY8860251.1 GntR family transcriptional regulator [Nocardia coffeae]
MTTEQTATVLEWTRLRDEVCEQLRDRIIAGQFEPGHRLVERDLAEQFGVSRIPVREAIQTLITEGFVEVLSPRKIVVKRISQRDVEELFGVREALETYAAREATLRADAGDLRTLQRLVEKARRATLSGHPDRISRANAEFHRHIIDMAGNRLLADLLRPLEGRLRWLFQQIDDPGQLWCEHRALYEAIASGDAQIAADHALRHVRENRAIALNLLFRDDRTQ